jgi:hypothetical protein
MNTRHRSSPTVSSFWPLEHPAQRYGSRRNRFDWVRLIRLAAAIGFLVQLATATPANAAGTDDAAIAGGAVAGFSAILCGAVGQAFDLKEPEENSYARRG